MKNRITLANCLRTVVVSVWQSDARAASLSGVVLEEGEAVDGAELILVNAENHVRIRQVYSDEDGSFRFEVTTGRYNPGIFKIATSSPMQWRYSHQNLNTVSSAVSPLEAERLS